MVTQFTPLASTFGGTLIGAAAVIWMLFNGRISGISGILGSLLPPYANASFAEAAAFILGLVGAPLLWMVLTARPIQQSVSTNVVDGHGRPIGWDRYDLRVRLHQWARGVRISTAILPFIGGHADLHGDWLRHGVRDATRYRRLSMRIATSVLAGLTFGLGLVISGLVNPAKVLNFLDLLGSWDPSLAFVMAAAVGVTFVGYKLAFRRPSPLLVDQFQLPVAKQIDRRLVIGPAIFGIGWGLSGFCPGPAITSLPLLANGTLVFVPAMLAGMALTRLAVQPGTKAKSVMPPAGAGETR